MTTVLNPNTGLLMFEIMSTSGANGNERLVLGLLTVKIPFNLIFFQFAG